MMMTCVCQANCQIKLVCSSTAKDQASILMNEKRAKNFPFKGHCHIKTSCTESPFKTNKKQNKNFMEA